MTTARPGQFDFAARRPVKVGVLMDLVFPQPGTFDVRQTSSTVSPWDSTKPW